MWNWWRRGEVLDEPSVAWLFEVYGWALNHLDGDYFQQQTPLVLPDNRYFPGQVDSAEAMLRLVFERTLGYAGMGHWPVEASSWREPGDLPPFEGPLRQVEGRAEGGEPVYPIPVDANLAREPETLIAHQAHHLAHYLCRGARVQTPPPGGEANWAQVTEVVAVFLGFGVMMANTAFVARRGGCGSCGVPVQRHSSLSQFDLTYALGLFSVLKGLPARAVLPGLKKSLRPYFKSVLKDLAARQERLQALAVAA